MTITLYSVSGAPSPWRVQVGLALKGLPYDVKTLSAAKKEHKSDEFRKLSPRGTVPVLIDRDMALTDSVGSLAWLDRAYPDRPLFGRTPAEAARIWQRVATLAEYLPPAVSGVLRPIFFGDETASLDDAGAALIEELQPLEAALTAHPYLCGDQPSAADAVCFPHIRLIQRGVETHGDDMSRIGLGDLDQKFPNLTAWIARIEALPGVERTFPPHWQYAA